MSMMSMRMAVRMPVTWIIASKMRQVWWCHVWWKEKKAGMELCTMPSYSAGYTVVRVPIRGKRTKPYNSTGSSKCLAPYKFHVKSLAMLETCEFLSHSRQYPGPCHSYLHNDSLSYQFCLTESLCLLVSALQPICAAVLIQLLLPESVPHRMLQIQISFNTSVLPWEVDTNRDKLSVQLNWYDRE